MAQRPCIFLAQALDEDARVHAGGAAGAAQAVGGTGGLAHIFILFFEFFKLVAAWGRFTQAAYFTIGRDALARRERKVAGRAYGFTEAALHAFIHKVVGRVQGLEMLDMPLRVVVHEHAGVENALGIQQFLDGLHDGICGRAPFHFNKGGHVAAGAVLGLEGAVVFFGDKLAEVVHKGRIARHFGGSAKVLPEYEVQVAVTGVTEERGHGIAMPDKEGLQVCSGFAQAFKGKGHVFDNNGRTHGAHAAY